MAGKASDEAERVAVEQSATEGEAVNAALGHVSQIVENIAKALNLPSAATPVVAAVAAPTIEEGVEKAMTMKDLMKAMGKEMDEEAEKKMKAAGFDPNQKFPTAKPPVDSTKTSKALVSAEASEAFSMDSFVDLITKAKKFTPGRVEKLKGAYETLKALLDEIEQIPQGTMPGVSPGGSTQFGGSGVKVLTEKSANSPEFQTEVLKALTELATVVKSLQGEQAALKTEVETVAKARPASESLEAAGITESKVTKSALWSGVL